MGSALYPALPEKLSTVVYTDRTLSCVDCGIEFVHSAADQEHYAQKGFTSDPKRCASCRAYRRSTREPSAGGGLPDGRPGSHDASGLQRGSQRESGGPREYFVAICTSCGNQAQVPFKPRMDKPVYCSDCFRQVKPD